MVQQNLWLVLIDTSASMGSGFSSKGPSAGRVRRGGWETKIDAAKELLSATIKSLRTPDVAVVEFTSRSALLFHAPSREFSRYESSIQKLTANDGTDLAAALENLPATIAGGHFQDLHSYSEVQILVITDGLTDARSAGAAAHQLISDLRPTQIRIRVLLVDQTPEGDETAYSVATNDDVEYAQSYEATRTATQASAAKALSYNLATAGAHQRALYREQAALLGSAPLSTIGFVGSSSDRTNSAMLRSEIVPAIEALEQIQEVASSDGVSADVEIYTISKSSDLKVSVSGIAKAIEVVDERFTPWKREHAQYMAQLEREEKELELRKLRAEAREAERNIVDLGLDRRYRELELRREEAKVEREVLENEALRLKLARAKLDRKLVAAAQDITHVLCSNYDLPEDELSSRQIRVKEALEILSGSKYLLEHVVESDVVD
jgi:hypothetical protein